MIRARWTEFDLSAGLWVVPAERMELLRGMRPGLTVHGFRSSFRDWAAENTTFPVDVVEMALAHTIQNQVEAAHRRGDLLDKRRALMQEWADYLDKFKAGSDAVERRG